MNEKTKRLLKKNAKKKKAKAIKIEDNVPVEDENTKEATKTKEAKIKAKRPTKN